MDERAVLFSDSLDDLVFVREHSTKSIRYASDLEILEQLFTKFPIQEVIAKSSLITEEFKMILSQKSCQLQEFSSLAELQLRIEDDDSILPHAHTEHTVTAVSSIESQMADFSPTFASLVGSSPAMQKLRADLLRVARFDVSVLLIGETGTGKTTIARAIHELSARRKMPFKDGVLSNSNESVIEAKLFGVSKGGFTGAVEGKGLFEEANGGTLFLDEIGEITPNIQTKLLQVLSEGIINRVGSNKDIHIDTRMIFATNANLETKIKIGTFREDLFYRINDVTIRLPPLRDRIEDIPQIARSFLKRNNIKKELSPSAITLLQSLTWRGNIRQLEKVIRNAALLYCDGECIEPQHIRL
ncbi:MAG: sigma-54-dependent Fis family transcriptional regulator [Treponema sp.]|nr:sigma-54-dependent Fis family transcriptional regulator [Treponema sp.]